MQPITMDQEGIEQMLKGRQPGPEQQRLASMASGECSADECFDGKPILRREPPLVILEEKKIGEYYAPPYWERERSFDDCYGGHDYPYGGHWRGGHCHRRWDSRYVPGRVASEYRQKVGIEDRDAYVGEKKTKGLLFGGLFGGIAGALVGFLVNPILGVGILAAGVVAGYFKGKKDGESQPKVFHRTETRSHIVDRPYP